MERKDLRFLPNDVEAVYCAAPGKLIGGEMVPVSMCLNCKTGECASFKLLDNGYGQIRLYLPKFIPSWLIDRPESGLTIK